MTTLKQRLMNADRVTVLRFLSQLIHAFTIHARSNYDHPSSRAVLVETNETIHRLAGHLRDLISEAEVLTESRADSISAHAELLLPTELERVVVWSKV